jgi:hypothetical protein
MKAVLIAIASHMPDSWPSQELLAAESGFSVSVVAKAIKDLEDIGILARRVRPGKTDRFFIKWAMPDPVQEALDAEAAVTEAAEDAPPPSGFLIVDDDETDAPPPTPPSSTRNLRTSSSDESSESADVEDEQTRDQIPDPIRDQTLEPILEPTTQGKVGDDDAASLSFAAGSAECETSTEGRDESDECSSSPADGESSVRPSLGAFKERSRRETNAGEVGALCLPLSNESHPPSVPLDEWWELFDALIHVCDEDAPSLTESERGAAGNALKLLLKYEPDMDRDWLAGMASSYRDEFPDLELTPMALYKFRKELVPDEVTFEDYERPED